ncbi:Signal transduction histidine kinase [Mameliella alba]|uniref:ATP-binding protein n=1 Tax=Mameliella alba TaxID=561184 RepID=UPI0008847B0C|nr:ATP-binding protein [Mameliella alba]OWV50364.1 hypothetical protein CDZ96_02375 [Mameliella alba]PTR42230.1 signal transduction histidine kinase [Mameliella alba]GGF56179.1 two-component system sensor histidine kinase/response regulator [Mameliella alba]SDC02873.1 Signal transduction histidine kinase [Mameliella alba]
MLGAGAALLAVGVLTAGFYRSHMDSTRLREVELRLSDLSQELLGAIGFDGMIHDFKNCVLRGATEPAYCDEAEVEAHRALAVLDRMDEVAEANGLVLDLAAVRASAADYGARVDRVRAAHDRGLSAGQIDVLVRYDDEPAVEGLRATLDLARQTLDDRLTALQRDYAAMTLVGVLFPLVLSVWFLLAARRDFRAAMERQAQLDAIFAALTGGLVGFDEAGQIVLINPTARRFLHVGDRAVPFDWPDHVSLPSGPEGDEPSLDPVTWAMSGGSNGEEVRQLRIAIGQEPDRYMRLGSARINLRGTRLSALLYMQDVTLEERNRQVIERDSRLDALGQLSGGIAHDFNNLLATLLFSMELALQEEPSERAASLLRRAREAVWSGRGLTDRLLAFARQQPGRVEVCAVDCVLEDIEILSRPALSGEVALRLLPEEPQLQVRCDPGQLQNALLNLVLNARDAIRGAGRAGIITLGARAVGDDLVELSVGDDGEGMSDEVRRRAADPFFTTRRGHGGTGLGLAMVYGFVQQSGGDMRIYSVPGQGTTVRLTLPRIAGTPGLTVADSWADMPAGAGETVLLVEDEPYLLDLTRGLLQRLGYEVVTAPTGQAAWALIEAGQAYDLLLTDVFMPGGLSGLDLAERVAARDPARPVILMSGFALHPDVGAAGPRFRHLQKPCTPHVLARTLREALETR